jgi:hypothetical protein
MVFRIIPFKIHQPGGDTSPGLEPHLRSQRPWNDRPARHADHWRWGLGKSLIIIPDHVDILFISGGDRGAGLGLELYSITVVHMGRLRAEEDDFRFASLGDVQVTHNPLALLGSASGRSRILGQSTDPPDQS